MFIATGQKEFGMEPVKGVDQLGNQINKWSFNITRYVQNVVNGKEPAYTLRLSSPFALQKELVRSNTIDLEGTVLVNPVYGIGRVRVGGGNHPTQKMKLRIIYSRI